MPNDKKKMQKPNKPKSSMLGTGMARKAADALTEREKKIRMMMKSLNSK